MRIKKRLIAVAAVTAAVAIGGGIAFAAWTASGNGSGSGAATVAQSLVVTAETPSGANASLYPGGPAGPIFFTVNNPNPYAITLTGITYGTPTSTNTGSSASTNIALDAGAPTTISLNIPANSTSPLQQVNGVLDLAHTAGNGCQGVAFNVGITVTGTQQ